MRYFFSCGKTVELLALDPLLLLILPLAVHHANLEMIAPVCLQNVLLAVRALLVICLILLFLLRFANVVFNNFHSRIKCLIDLNCCHLLRHCLGHLLVINKLLILQNLSLYPFLLLSEALLILVHQLLLRKHFLIIV